MLQQVSKFSERFIPQRETMTQNEVSRLRVFINSSIIAALFSFGYTVMTVLFAYPIGTVGLVISGVLFLSFPFLIRLGAPYVILANAFVSIVFLSMVVYILTQGGLRIAVVAPWLVFITCISVLFLNVRFALVWTTITALSAIGMLVLETFPVNLPVAFDTRFDLLYRGIVWVGLLFLILLVINEFKNSENQAKRMLAEKNDELEMTMYKLQVTQDQLIEKEKLASLGQVTAGIAHEIQNPLNFIKNFSELSLELIEESGDHQTEEDRSDFLTTLRLNLQKISEHTLRTDKIVKNMLAHAHIHGNEQILTSINSLCAEALSMTLQSLKVREQFPSLRVETYYDTSDPYCRIMPSDTARILVNLINNAIYSLQQKASLEKGFEPVLQLSTQLLEGQVVLRITDNGMGVPHEIRKDIFKPFFTTKPTGEGTGLGLSLSNTIMQAQGGSINLEPGGMESTTFKLSFSTT